MSRQRVARQSLGAHLRWLWIRGGDAVVLWLVQRWSRIRYRGLAKSYRRRDRNRSYWPCIATPRCANDKFLWRKIFDRDPRFVVLCGKLSCREWMRTQRLGLGMVELLWVGTSAADIPDSLLRGDVVIKPNAGSGQHRFIRGGDYDRAELVRTTRRWLNKPHGRRHHEWGYLHAPRLLLMESMIRPDNGVLDELKLYTFGDRIERVVYIRGRFGAMEAGIWEPDDRGRLTPSPKPAAVADRPCSAPLPATIDHAMDCARRIGQAFDHLRVDLYTDGHRLWFGELTVYNQTGLISHDGYDPDSRVSRAWDIRRANSCATRRCEVGVLGTQLHCRAGWSANTNNRGLPFGRPHRLRVGTATVRPQAGSPAVRSIVLDPLSEHDRQRLLGTLSAPVSTGPGERSR